METNTTTQEETLKDTAEDLVQHASDFLETLYKKIVLQVTQKGVEAGASAITGLLTAFMGFFVFLFAMVGLAFWIGDLINSRAGGFFLVAGFFALLLIILVAARKSILTSLRNKLTRKIYE